MQFWLWNTRPYDVVLHPFYSQGQFVSFEHIYGREPKIPFKQDPLKNSLRGVRDEYVDFENEFMDDIYPMEGEFIVQNSLVLKKFEI